MVITNLHFNLPGLLVLLAIIPLFVAMYVLILRRKKKYALGYSSLELIRPALDRGSSLRRHIPAALYLLALASLLTALARPTALVNGPAPLKTIILVMDVSNSMDETDLPPSRLKAAEHAALSFIQLKSEDVQIGIVVFSTRAELIVPPTTNREQLKTAILSLTTGDGTAIGSSIYTALDAIPKASPVQKANGTNAKQKALLPNTYTPEIIILLTDGENNFGPQPVDAAREAAARGVRIYTIGIATQPSVAVNNGNPGSSQIPNTGWSGYIRNENDIDTLKTIASMTSGKYYAPKNAAELGQVFAGLTRVQARKVEDQEISVVFCALGALLACAAITLSLSWQPLL